MGSTFWTYDELELIEADRLKKSKIDRGDIDLSITGEPSKRWNKDSGCEDCEHFYEGCMKTLRSCKRK
jgi:hypothetical protein